MASRKRLVVIGDGPDVLVARGIISPGTSEEAGSGTVAIKLVLNEEACRSGVRLLQLLSAAIGTGDIRAIARLRLYCPEIVERAPMLHTFLDSLHRAGRSTAIARILGGPRRGRRATLPHLAAAVAAIVQSEGLSPTEAADAVAARYGGQLGNVGTKALLNAYSGINRELLELYRGPQAVPGSVLTRSHWNPPERQDHGRTSPPPTREERTMSKGHRGRGTGGQGGGTKGSGEKGSSGVPNLPSTTGQSSGGGRGNAPAR